MHLVLLSGQFWFHLAVSLINNGQEHINEDEEYEENVEQEKEGAQHAMRLGQLLEIEIAENDAK